MAARECAETKYGLALVAEGKSISEAARMAGIARSTLHRAIARKNSKKLQAARKP